MAESAFIVCVPEAESYVAALRERFDASARLGVPAHITVLYPFMPPEQIDAVTVKAVQELLKHIRPFTFTLNRVGRFPGAAYLAPQPAESFAALTKTFVARFPHFPPYRGAFQAIIPHLTVAQGGEEEAATAEASLQQQLTQQGPVHSSCTAVTLIENSSGRWRAQHVFNLAGVSGA
jgi:2'-5' RNA ligase